MKGFWEFMSDPNLIGSFLGAFLSGSIALLIYWLDKRDRKKQKKQEFQKVILELKDYKGRIDQTEPIMTKTIKENIGIDLEKLNRKEVETLRFSLKGGMALISSELERIHLFLENLSNKEIPVTEKSAILKLKNESEELQKNLKLLFENEDILFIILAPNNIDRYRFREDYFEKIESIKSLIEGLETK